jgi:hypothetical protein
MLAAFRKLDNLLGYHRVHGIVAIFEPKDYSSGFERDAHDARRLRIEPATFQIWGDGHEISPYRPRHWIVVRRF